MERNRILIAIAVLSIAILFIRFIPLTLFNVTDSLSMDAFIAIQKTVVNNYIIPPAIINQSTDQVPYAFHFNEAHLQIYFAIVPYYFLNKVLTLSQTEYLVWGAFILLSIYEIIFFCKRIGGSYKVAIPALVIFLILPTAITSQEFGTWAGSFFMPILLLASIIMLILAKDNIKNKPNFCIYMLYSLLLVVSAYFSWTGGIFAVVGYGFAAAVLVSRKQDFRKIVIVAVVLSALFIIVEFNAYGGISSIEENIVILITQNTFINLTSTLFVIITFTLVGLSIFLLSVLLADGLKAIKTLKNKKSKEIYYIILIESLLALPITIVVGFIGLLIIEYSILAGFGLFTILTFAREKRTKMLIIIVLMCVSVLSILMMTIRPSDVFINSQYISALTWVRNNTPQNATFLTYAWDSIGVQYYANRSVYSGWWYWNGENGTSSAFADWLYTYPCQSTYLNITDPAYIIINRFWNNETNPPYGETEGIVSGYNLSIPATNQTFQELISKENVSCGGIELNLVYRNNQTSNFKVRGNTNESK